MSLRIDQIPSDLAEMIEEGEHALGSYSEEFEKAMFEHGLMEYGSSRRSHRIITEKCIDLDYWGTMKLLTGLTESEILAYWENINKETKVKCMFQTAELYGYKISKI